MSPPSYVGAAKELIDSNIWQVGGGAAKGLVEVVSESGNWLNQRPAAGLSKTFEFAFSFLVDLNLFSCCQYIFQKLSLTYRSGKIDVVETVSPD